MISEEFKKNVKSGDVDTVRSALIDYLIIDRTFKSFDEAFKYAKISLNITEPFNIEPAFSEEPWDKNYLNKQKVLLMMNFSNERIEHLKEVILKVLPKNTIEKKDRNDSRSSKGFSRERHSSTNSNSRTGRKIISEEFISDNRLEKNKKSKKDSNIKRRKDDIKSNSKKTGSIVTSEVSIIYEESEKKTRSKDPNIGNTIIIGGVAVTAAGVITVKPLIIGTGVVITSFGIIVKKGR